MKILIVEDEKLLADSLQVMLEKKGFEVQVVYDGESGAEYAELGVYDLLILDVMMPKMDGYEVARQVRRNRCSTPILMLTARSGLEDRIMGLNAGADYYLTKPFDSRELLACINALLRRQGEPLSQEDCENIFKRFYRADPARSMNHSYGLGLPIARQIVDEHGGKIWAASRDGWNTFFVSLPVKNRGIPESGENNP